MSFLPAYTFGLYKDKSPFSVEYLEEPLYAVRYGFLIGLAKSPCLPRRFARQTSLSEDISFAVRDNFVAH